VVVQASSGVSRSNLCSTASTCSSPKSFFANITALCLVESSVSVKMEFTWSVMFDLLGYHCKGGKQFYDYSDYDFVNSSCLGDFGINIQAIHYVFDGLEKIDKCIIARIDTLDRLLSLGCHNSMHMRVEKGTHTASRIARPANIAFSGGNGYRWSIRDMKHASAFFDVLSR